MATARSTRLINETIARMDRAIAESTRGVRAEIVHAQRRVVNSIARGILSPENAFATHLVPLEDVLSSAISSSMLKAYLNAQSRFIEPEVSFAERPASVKSETVEGLSALLKISPARVKQITDKFSADAKKHVKDANGLLGKKLLAVTKQLVQRGAHTKEGVAIVRKALGGGEDKSVYETVFRSATQMANSAGRWVASQQPRIQSILWGYEYVTVGDDRVREEHAALDGVRLPKGHLLWKTIWPPNGWNCRCDTIEIFRGERIATIKMPREGWGVDKGWSFNPGMVFEKALEAA